MVRYKIMVREFGEKRWLNWNKSKWNRPQLQTYATRAEAEKLAKALRKLYRNEFKVKRAY